MRVLLELDNGDLGKTHPVDPQFLWRWSKEMREILKEKDSSGESEWELIPFTNSSPTQIVNRMGHHICSPLAMEKDWLDATQSLRRKPARPVLALGYRSYGKIRWEVIV
jgi:hypothetical protein